jgi:hypothetical protein
MKLIVKQNGDDCWDVFDADEEPAESNYYGMIEAGFATKANALKFIAENGAALAEAEVASRRTAQELVDKLESGEAKENPDLGGDAIGWGRTKQ